MVAKGGPKHVRIADEDRRRGAKVKPARSQRQSEAPERRLLPAESSTRVQRSHLELEVPTRPLSGHVASRKRAAMLNARIRERVRIDAEERQPEALELSLAKDRRRRKVSRLSGYDPISLVYRFFSDPVLRFWFGCNFCFAASLYAGTVLFMIVIYPSIRGLFMY